MEPGVVAPIDGLRELKAVALIQKYRELFGEESKSSYRQFLFQRVAWRLQARAAADLSERARRRATEIVDDADMRTKAPKGLSPQDASAPWANKGRGIGDCRRLVYGVGWLAKRQPVLTASRHTSPVALAPCEGGNNRCGYRGPVSASVDRAAVRGPLPQFERRRAGRHSQPEQRTQ
jgi:hypothetical protein